MRGALLAAAALMATACQGSMDAYFAGDVVEQIDDVPYLDGSTNPRQMLDLYLPRETTGFPVVVFVHGGYWIAQDKKFFDPIVGLYGNVGRALARRGIGVAVINYRLVPDVTFADQFADVAHAVAWVHDHIGEHGGDGDRLVLAGHSAGGHMTALAGFDTARFAALGVAPGVVRGFVPLSPIFDLEHMAANPPPDRPGFNDEVTEPTFGDDLAANSPRTYFNADGAPMLVLLGDADEPYLLDQVPAGVAELEALGAPVTYGAIAGTSHDDMVLSIDGDDDAITPLIAAFVNDVAP